MNRGILLLLLAGLSVTSWAQFPEMNQQGYTLALPNHLGLLHLEAPSFPIVEASAKPAGTEFGLRGSDDSASIDLLVFLFLYPEEAPLTSEKCRDAILGHLAADNPTAKIGATGVLSERNLPLAFAEYVVRGAGYVVRAFVAQGDLCSDVEFSSKSAISVKTPAIQSALASLTFDPNGKPGFREVFYYASVLYSHKAYVQAAPLYEKSVQLLSSAEPNDKWRRIATDQAVIAYGVSGNIAKARTLLMTAVKVDPDYAMNYYNLACADAEEGNAGGAKVHLQQAFARKQNVIAGEALPDPTKDDSFTKLQNDRAFWKFVQSLSAN
jgi:tetratricopeptide (TPR) repeat protein